MTRRIAVCGILTAFALIIHIIEAQIPVIVAIPGIKLGLANIVTLAAFCLFSWKEALAILTLRCFLGNVLSGQIGAMFFSLNGALFSFAVMCFMIGRKSNYNIVIVSIISAVFNNIGQIVVACCVSGTSKIILYLPFLLISGIITGTFIGILASLSIKRLKNALKR